MSRRPQRRADPPSLTTPVALAVAALAGLAFARWRLARPDPAPAVRLDAGSYVTAVAPLLRRAGCAAPACHGGPARPRFVPSPNASELLAELDSVRADEPRRNALWSRATDRAHAGAGALPPGGCEAAMLARWVGGDAVRPCAPALPDGGR